MYLTSRQVAEKLNVSMFVVRKLARQGILPAANRTDGGPRVNYMFHPKTIRLFKQARLAAPTPDPSPVRRRTPPRSVTDSRPAQSDAVVTTRLARIEALLDKLTQLWS